METKTIPIFPLDLVLFPRQELPLKIFEPRYKQLVEDCTLGDGLFGVCLTGPGDVSGWSAPVGVGTVTKITRCQDVGLDGMQLHIDTVGRGKFRIVEIIPPCVWMPPDYDPSTLEGHQRFQELYERSGPGRMYIRAEVRMIPEIDQSIPEPRWRGMVESWKRKAARLAGPQTVDPRSLDHILERYYLVTDTPTPDYVYSLAALGAGSPEDLQPILEADTAEELMDRVEVLMEGS